MMPATRKLIDLMRSDRPGLEDVDGVALASEPDDPYDPKLLQLRLKRKYQLGMIKKMMEEGGYGDLAKMTTIGKKSYETEE